MKRATLLIALVVIASMLLAACTPAATPTAVPPTKAAEPTKAPAAPTAAPTKAPAAATAAPTKAPEPTKPAAETPRKGGTLNLGLPVDPGTMDPRLQNDTSAANINDLVYNGLIYNDENLKAQPDLAEKWENPTPTTWVFYLKKGVKFHDGTELKAADVKYTFETIVDPKFNSPRRSLYAAIKNVDVVDDYTVRINLNNRLRPASRLSGHGHRAQGHRREGRQQAGRVADGHRAVQVRPLGARATASPWSDTMRTTAARPTLTRRSAHHPGQQRSRGWPGVGQPGPDPEPHGRPPT